MKLALYLTLALLAACASQPPLPKQPDESHRVPLNKTIQDVRAEAVSVP